MNGRGIAALLLVIVLGLGAVALGVGAYQAGLAAGAAQPGVAVAPGAVAYYGWHPFGWGFGFFGFLGTLLFLFLIFALIRAAFGGRRRGWGGPWGPRGYVGDHGRGPGESHLRDTFEEWHRRSHEGEAAGPATGTASRDPGPGSR